MPVDATPLCSTHYRVSDEMIRWAQSELQDYIHPVGWEVQKETDGKSMFRKKFPPEVTSRESPEHRAAAYWKFSAVIPGAEVSDLYDIMHRQCTKYQQYLTEGFDGAELVEVISPDRAGPWPDEAVVQYRAYKLPVVSNRDFFTLTFQKNFTMPDGRPGIGLFTKSVYDYPNEAVIPPRKNVVRAEVISCCVFLVPTPEGCFYTYTQRAQVNLAIPIPKTVIRWGEKAHIWRHFDVIRQCVKMHQEGKRKGHYAAVAAHGASAAPVATQLPSLPPLSAFGTPGVDVNPTATSPGSGMTGQPDPYAYAYGGNGFPTSDNSSSGGYYTVC